MTTVIFVQVSVISLGYHICNQKSPMWFTVIHLSPRVSVISLGYYICKLPKISYVVYNDPSLSPWSTYLLGYVCPALEMIVWSYSATYALQHHLKNHKAGSSFEGYRRFWVWHFVFPSCLYPPQRRPEWHVKNHHSAKSFGFSFDLDSHMRVYHSVFPLVPFSMFPLLAFSCPCQESWAIYPNLPWWLINVLFC
jgi:hypothetical protein